jgi:hypothetical protein
MRKPESQAFAPAVLGVRKPHKGGIGQRFPSMGAIFPYAITLARIMEIITTAMMYDRNGTFYKETTPKTFSHRHVPG